MRNEKSLYVTMFTMSTTSRNFFQVAVFCVYPSRQVYGETGLPEVRKYLTSPT